MKMLHSRLARAPIAVIGAGVVGCATAYMLTQAGYPVILIEKASDVATGASHANGAQLSYSFVEPMATPSILKNLPNIVVGGDSALRFYPTASISQLRWGLSFIAACRGNAVENTTRQLLKLAEQSRIEIDKLVEAGIEFGHANCGKLVLLESVTALKHARATVMRQSHFGARQRIVTTAECIALEPALAQTKDSFVGAIWSETDALCDPQLLCRSLINLSQKQGLETRFDCAVTALIRKRGVITALRTASGDIAASAVVIANGMNAVELMKSIKVALPIQPIKGYSVTLPAEQVKQMPQRSITDLARKIVYAPLGNALRVAGFAELAARDTVAKETQILALLDATSRRFGFLNTSTEISPWAGLRPATPTSCPIISRTKLENLFLNVGHGALGLTLAMGSARTIEKLVSASRQFTRQAA